MGYVPTYLSSLRGLQDLDLSFNRITHWECLAQLTSLTKLSMNYCHLTNVPSTLTALTLLKRVYMIHNNIASLPMGLPWCNLETLFLADNQLRSVPWRELLCAKELVALCLSGNNDLQVHYDAH